MRKITVFLQYQIENKDRVLSSLKNLGFNVFEVSDILNTVICKVNTTEVSRLKNIPYARITRKYGEKLE